MTNFWEGFRDRERVRYSSRRHSGHGLDCDGQCEQLACVSCGKRLWDCKGDYKRDEFVCADCQRQG